MPVATVLADFTSTTSPEVIPRTAATLTMEANPDNETLNVNVRVEPSVEDWGAGEFTSSIRVGGQGFDSVTIPVKLTFRSGPFPSGGFIAMLVLVIGVVIGLVFKAYGEPVTGNNAAQLSWRQPLERLIKGAPAITGFLTGAVVVAFGFDSQYLDNNTFGADGLTDWLELGAWGFAGGFSGRTISDVTASKAR